MAISLFKSIGGYCDYLDMEHEIKVYFQKKHYPRQATPVNLPTGFECRYSNTCQYGNKCPIWKCIQKMTI